MTPETPEIVAPAIPRHAYVVGVCLDGPLRNITEPFYRAYAERFGPEAADETHVVNTRWQSEEEAQAAEAAGEQTADGKLRLVIEQQELPEGVQPMKPLRLVKEGEERALPALDELNPFNLLEKLDFRTDEEIEDFVHGEGFFVFARAPQTEYNLPTWLNELYHGVHAQGGRVVLLANDGLKLRPAALFFAANIGAAFDEVRFAGSAEAYWEGIDVLVTASARLRQAAPEGKRVAYVLTDYNNPENEAPAAALDFDPYAPYSTASLPAGVTCVRGIQHLLEYFPH